MNERKKGWKRDRKKKERKERKNTKRKQFVLFKEMTENGKRNERTNIETISCIILDCRDKRMRERERERAHADRQTDRQTERNTDG